MTTLTIRTPRTLANQGLRSNEAGYPAARARLSQVGGNGLVYLFPYAPVAVRFDSVGAEYQEIQRPGTYSLVARRAPNLLKVAFDFRIAHRPTNGLRSISRDLDILRRIAAEDSPVIVSGMGGYLAGAGANSSVKFRVTTLNVETVTLSPENNDPWQANATLELIEDRNPAFTVANFTRIDYPAYVQKKATPTRSTPPATDWGAIYVAWSQLNANHGGGGARVVTTR